jgi:hypothetical protein
MTCCDIDLTAPPFGVVAGDPSAGTANTAAINAAITTYSGTRARLLLPAGDIYVDQANGHDNWSVKFAAGVSDLALAGHGMFATRIVVQGAGDGGEWHGIMIDGASRIEFSDFGIQMGVVCHPDPGDQNHLVSIYCSAGQTSDIVGRHLFFGQAVGDGLRILGMLLRSRISVSPTSRCGWPGSARARARAWRCSAAGARSNWGTSTSMGSGTARSTLSPAPEPWST